MIDDNGSTLLLLFRVLVYLFVLLTIIAVLWVGVQRILGRGRRPIKEVLLEEDVLFDVLLAPAIVTGLATLALACLFFLVQAVEPSAGEVRKLTAKSSEGAIRVRVPASEDAGKEDQKLMAAHDELGLSLQVLEGQVLLVENKTPVRVIERERFAWGPKCRVRILEGEHTGRTGWVPCGRLSQ